MKVTHPKDVIYNPILTEESTIQTEAHNKYTFRVNPRANKIQIREAVEQLFNVRVSGVNTMNYMGKVGARQSRGAPGRRAMWKKAVVTLQSGDTIDLI